MDVATIARVCHEANRGLQAGEPTPGIPVAAPWDDFGEQAGVINGVEKALEGASPEELHQNWCEFKIREGWTYGEAKDSVLKTHPCLVPYGELPAAQLRKDSLFSAIVNALRG